MVWMILMPFYIPDVRSILWPFLIVTIAFLKPKIFLLPLFNDWDSCKILLNKINDKIKKLHEKAEVVIVNDNSNINKPKFKFFSNIDKIKILNLNTSDPTTIKTEKIEKIIKLPIKLKLPFVNSSSFLTYREKSPKLVIIIEKYAKIVPVTVNKGKIF